MQMQFVNIRRLGLLRRINAFEWQDQVTARLLVGPAHQNTEIAVYKDSPVLAAIPGIHAYALPKDRVRE